MKTQDERDAEMREAVDHYHQAERTIVSLMKQNAELQAQLAAAESDRDALSAFAMRVYRWAGPLDWDEQKAIYPLLVRVLVQRHEARMKEREES